MGCFLTMTDRDLAQLRGALKTAVSVLGTAGPGQVKIQVSDVCLLYTSDAADE